MSSTENADPDSTINEESQETEQLEETSTYVSTETEDVDPDLPKSKSVKKLLEKKNEAEKEKAELVKRIEELEQKAQVNDFLKQYPQAEEILDDLKERIESWEVKSLDSAYKLHIAEDPALLAQLKSSSPLVWSTPRWVHEDKSLDSMSDDELEAQARRDMAKLG